jgi:RHS repeat-associated protein
MMNLRTTLCFFALTLVSWRVSADTAAAVQAAKVASMSTADFGSYTYDDAGNIKGIGADRFTYDEYGRIKTARLTQGATTVTQSFTYDRYGNILSIATSGGDTIVPAVDPLTNRIDKATTTTNALGAYDANGNMTSYNTVDSFHYDPLDVMSGSTVNGERRVYLYGPGNERVATLKINAGGSVTGSTWTLRDASAKVLRRLSKDAAGVWRWDEDYVYNGSQMLAAEVPGNTLQFHLDHLGTPRVITGNGGVRLATHTYFPFGRETSASTPDAETKKFTGHERDDINLDYMHARYYVPYAGRFLSVDPTWESADASRPQSWNRYAYVENNPINKVDPDGKNPLGALIGGAISVSIESYKQVTCNCPVNNRRLLAALAGGAVAGATGGLGGATLRGAVGFGALGGVLGGATERGINKGEKIVDKALVTDAVTGAIGGAAGQKLGQAMVRSSQSSGTLNTLAIQGAAQRGEAAAANAGLGADRETARQAATLVRGITGGGDVAGNAAGEVVKSEISQVKKELEQRERQQQ